MTQTSLCHLLPPPPFSVWTFLFLHLPFVYPRSSERKILVEAEYRECGARSVERWSEKKTHYFPAAAMTLLFWTEVKHVQSEAKKTSHKRKCAWRSGAEVWRGPRRETWPSPRTWFVRQTFSPHPVMRTHDLARWEESGYDEAICHLIPLQQLAGRNSEFR